MCDFTTCPVGLPPSAPTPGTNGRTPSPLPGPRCCLGVLPGVACCVPALTEDICFSGSRCFVGDGLGFAPAVGRHTGLGLLGLAGFCCGVVGLVLGTGRAGVVGLLSGLVRAGVAGLPLTGVAF